MSKSEIVNYKAEFIENSDEKFKQEIFEENEIPQSEKPTIKISIQRANIIESSNRSEESQTKENTEILFDGKVQIEKILAEFPFLVFENNSFECKVTDLFLTKN